MSCEANKALVRRFYAEAVDQGNLALIDTLFTADYAFYPSGSHSLQPASASNNSWVCSALRSRSTTSSKIKSPKARKWPPAGPSMAPTKASFRASLRQVSD